MLQIQIPAGALPQGQQPAGSINVVQVSLVHQGPPTAPAPPPAFAPAMQPQPQPGAQQQGNLGVLLMAIDGQESQGREGGNGRPPAARHKDNQRGL
jgi:hypothetical protein